jgi:DoxX-like family
MKRVGWTMSVLLALFLLGASVYPKLAAIPAAAESMQALQWPLQHLRLIGVLELVATLLFLIPRTGFLGGLLLTAICGGAIASHLRVGSPLFGYTLFGVYLGIFTWVALYLRDEGFRKLINNYLAPNLRS